MLAFLICLLPDRAIAEEKNVDGVTVVYETLEDGTNKVVKVSNNSKNRITLSVDSHQVTVEAGESKTVDKISKKRVRLFTGGGKGGGTKTILTSQPHPAPTATDTPKPEEIAPQETTPEIGKPAAPSVVGQKKARDLISARQNTEVSTYEALDRVDWDSFFGTEAVNAYTQKAGSFTKALLKSGNKNQFLIDNDIAQFLTESESELKIKKSEISEIAKEAVAASRISDPVTQTNTLNGIIDMLNRRYEQRMTAYEKLKEAVDSIRVETDNEHPLKENIINYSIIGVIVLILAIWMIVAICKKKNKAKRQSVQIQQRDPDTDNPAIIVRRRTTSILKKQSLDDVINNPEYMLISSSEFSLDSAVRNIYIKNTCIKEVYNLYAEDLRDSNNPKEDGCMVLGRWVYSEYTRTYDISLETVVFPGDDAVFKEYELNFGGKIKLRIAEKLRKLRRETNLQYDLVCWIHSHPGLGVFFSNSDDNVQMQLRHSQHPYFLIAFVVDILTSDQEMGIFTFRKDGSMNSKNDLRKMYSLEEMYKWALESDKASFNPDKYHNILESANMKIPVCKGIELNNSSVIDLTQILIDPANGVVGWAVGTTVEHDGGKEYVVSNIVKAAEKPTVGVIGVLISVTHMSLPTIQRIIANENMSLSFVLVYSTRQNTLTSIPVVNGEIITDEHFYGEETIDELKIWTRRKR